MTLEEENAELKKCLKVLVGELIQCTVIPHFGSQSIHNTLTTYLPNGIKVVWVPSYTDPTSEERVLNSFSRISEARREAEKILKYYTRVELPDEMIP